MPVGPAMSTAQPYVRAGSPANDAGLGFGVQAGAELSTSLDGTPSRVAGVLIVSGAILALLRLSGFRFNVGVAS